MEGGPDSLKDWPRPHYQPGGGNAYLSFAVFGDINHCLTLSRTKYRSNGLADGLAVSAYARERDPEVFRSFLESRIFPESLDEDTALASVRAQNDLAVLRGEIGDPSDLNYLRDAVGVLTCMLDHGGVAILDMQTFKWRSATEWRSQIFEVERPTPGQHVVILVSDEESDGLWLHTRGMRTFGRPDISVRSVPPEGQAAIVDLCERFIGLHAAGGIIPDGQKIRVATVPDGMRCRHCGSLDDPDFNNVHVAIVWPPQG